MGNFLAIYHPTSANIKSQILPLIHNMQNGTIILELPFVDEKWPVLTLASCSCYHFKC